MSDTAEQLSALHWIDQSRPTALPFRDDIEAWSNAIDRMTLDRLHELTASQGYAVEGMLRLKITFEGVDAVSAEVLEELREAHASWAAAVTEQEREAEGILKIMSTARAGARGKPRYEQVVLNATLIEVALITAQNAKADTVFYLRTLLDRFDPELSQETAHLTNKKDMDDFLNSLGAA